MFEFVRVRRSSNRHIPPRHAANRSGSPGAKTLVTRSVLDLFSRMSKINRRRQVLVSEKPNKPRMHLLGFFTLSALEELGLLSGV